MSPQPRSPDRVPDAPLRPVAVSLDSSPMAVRDALRGLIAGLSPLGLEQEEKATVELVLAEVLNNVVEHACSDTRDDGRIHVLCSREPDGLHLLIRDQGWPMPENRLPNSSPGAAGFDMRELPEGGFGWLMIDALARDVRYDRVGDENRLSFRIAIAS